jgi:thioredoxin 1
MRGHSAFSTSPRSLGWVRALVELHGRELVRLVRQRGLSAREGFLGVEACFCAFLALPQAQQIAAQPDDTRRMMSLVLSAVVQTVQFRQEGPRPRAPGGEFEPTQIRLLLLDARAGVCEELGLDACEREELLSVCSEEDRRRVAAQLDLTPCGAARPSWGEDVFEQRLSEATTPVLVHFVASWCKPCLLIEPHLDQLARQRRGKLLVASVDVEENPKLPGRYRVRALPTLLLFREGREVNSLVGATTEQHLIGWVDSALASSVA